MNDPAPLREAIALKLIDTLKPFAEVADKLRHCHVVEICEPHPDNPSPNIVPMPREWFERAADDLDAIVIDLHGAGVLSEGQASKLTGLDRVEVRKLTDAALPTDAVQPVGGVDREAVARAINPLICDFSPPFAPKSGIGLALAAADRVLALYATAPTAGSGWLPIESAPKDGTEVLAMLAPKVIRLGWYFKRSSRTEGWCDENGKSITPTHWMPLPAAPTVARARTGEGG